MPLGDIQLHACATCCNLWVASWSSYPTIFKTKQGTYWLFLVQFNAFKITETLDREADFWTPSVNAPAAMPNGESITRSLGLNLQFSLFPQPCPQCHLYGPAPAESYSSPCHLLQPDPLPNWTAPNGPSYSPDFIPFSMEHNSAPARLEMLCCMKMDLWAQPRLCWGCICSALWWQEACAWFEWRVSEIERNRLFFTLYERNASLVIINVIYVTFLPFSVLVCGLQQEDKSF